MLLQPGSVRSEKSRRCCKPDLSVSVGVFVTKLSKCEMGERTARQTLHGVVGSCT